MGTLLTPSSIILTLLVLTRVTALVLVVPGLNLQVVSLHIRVALIGLLSVVARSTMVADSDTLDYSNAGLAIAQEAVIGCSLALVPAIMIWGTQLAAGTLRGLTGLPGDTNGGFGGTGNSPISQLLLASSTLVFFISGGHRQVVQGLIDSFAWFPAGQPARIQSAQQLLIDMLGQSFALGVRSISPIVLALLISLLAIGGLNRLVPQLSYFAVGMSFQAMVLVAALVVLVGAVLGPLADVFENLLDRFPFDQLALMNSGP